jgi:hypothetical protein
MGLRDKVFEFVPESSSFGVEHNGVQWYYGENWSMGFAPTLVSLWRWSCDMASERSDERLCWHTLPYVGGWRCGDALWLNSDGGWERVVYHRPGGL